MNGKDMERSWLRSMLLSLWSEVECKVLVRCV